MKLIKVKDNTQAMYYRLKDNRIGVIYPKTGYIRVSPSWINDPEWQEWYKKRHGSLHYRDKVMSTKNLTLHQINPVKKVTSPNGNYTYVRILFEDIWKMQEYLKEYEKKNCKVLEENGKALGS